jgi:hypothetical protein
LHFSHHIQGITSERLREFHRTKEHSLQAEVQTSTPAAYPLVRLCTRFKGHHPSHRSCCASWVIDRSAGRFSKPWNYTFANGTRMRKYLLKCAIKTISSALTQTHLFPPRGTPSVTRLGRIQSIPATRSRPGLTRIGHRKLPLLCTKGVREGHVTTNGASSRSSVLPHGSDDPC